MPETAGERRPLRIAFFGNANSVHLRRWAAYFADRGHEVVLFVATNAVLQPDLGGNIRVERFWPFSSRGRFPPLSYLRARRSIRGRMKRLNPDLVNGHYLNPHGWHAWMSGRHPYVVTLWGSDVFIRRPWPNDWLGRRTLRSADLVMVNSAALGQGAVRMGAPAERLQMVQWGVDMERFSPGPDPAELRARLGLAGRRVVFAPRAMASLYRQDVVVRAVKELPDDVSLVMLAGRSEPADVAAIRSLASSIGMTERLIMVPDLPTSEMPAMLRLADVVVSVPITDSTSSSMLEAMSCGCQIVATDLVSVREWLGGLEPGSLVPVDDVAATTAAIRRVLERSPQQRARLGAAARAIVAERADAAKTFAAIEDVYYDLVTRTGAAAR